MNMHKVLPKALMLWYSVVWGLTLTILILIGLSALIDPWGIKVVLGTTIEPIILILGAILWCGILLLILRITYNHGRLFMVIATIAILTIEVIIAINLQGANGVDDFNIRMQVASIVHGNFKLSPYFIYAANNVPITLLYGFIGIIASIFHITNLTILLNLVQFAFIDYALYLLVTMFRKMGKPVVANALMILTIVYLPILVYGANLYTDVISACLGIYGAVAFYHFTNSRKWWLLALAGALEGCAYIIKMNMVIMAIAILIYTTMSSPRKIKGWLKVLLIFGVGFALPVGTYKVAINTLTHASFSKSEIQRESYPYTFWINTGLSDQSNAPDAWLEGSKLSNYQTRDSYYKSSIASKIKSYRLRDWTHLYWSKINKMYSRGDLGSIDKNYGISRNMGNVFQHIAGVQNVWYVVYTQEAYLGVLLMMIIATLATLYKLSRHKTHQFGYLDLVGLFFIGIFLFHISMWEVLPRYSYVAMLVGLPLASMGLSETSVLLNNISNRETVILSGVGIAILVIMLVTYGNLTKKITKGQPEVVMSQVFPQNTFLPLNVPARGNLKERVAIPRSFRYINLTTWAGGKKISDMPGLACTVYNDKGKVIPNDMTVKPAGKYTIIVTNKTTHQIPIAIGKTYPVDLLQEPVAEHNNSYLNFNVTK